MFKRKIKVSIIIPVYNVQDYLRACLDSIVNQTLRELEIICIDDGSTDNSAEILHTYASQDKRITVIRQTNQGVAAARNQGLKIACGEYVGFVDSDDWIDLNFYETLYNAIQHAQADLARTLYKISTPQKETENIANLEIRQKIANGELLDKYTFTAANWNSLFRRKYLRQNKIDYFDLLTYAEDIPFIVRASFLSQKTIPVLGTYYHYRKDRPNQMTTLSLARLADTKKSFQIVFNFLNATKCQDLKDYLGAFACYLHMYDKIFWWNVLHLKEFTESKQKLFYAELVSSYRQCKHPELLKQQYPSLLYEYLDKEDLSGHRRHKYRQKQSNMLDVLTQYSAKRTQQI